MHARELALRRIAERQGGCFNRKQALAAGYSRSAMARMLSSGHWLDLGGGMLRAAQTPLTLGMRHHAVLGALGPRSFLSHGSSAAIHGLTPPPKAIWCSVPHTTYPVRLPGVETVRTRHVSFVTRNGLRLATPERSFCDLGMLLPRARLAAVLAAGMQAGKLRLGEVRSNADELFGRPGTTDLAEVLAEFRPEFESVLGREFLELVRLAGIPDVVPGFRIHLPGGRYRVADAAVEALRLDLEADGLAYHGLPAQIQADKQRDREISEVGWRTARFTTVDIRQHRDRTIAELPRVVAARAREIGLWRP